MCKKMHATIPLALFAKARGGTFVVSQFRTAANAANRCEGLKP